MLETCALDTVVGGMSPACKADIKGGALAGAAAGMAPALGYALPTYGESFMIPVAAAAFSALEAYRDSPNCR